MSTLNLVSCDIWGYVRSNVFFSWKNVQARLQARQEIAANVSQRYSGSYKFRSLFFFFFKNF